MNDTPRTDSARHNENDPYMAIASECSKLERELNAANDRIKRLEDAGDELLRDNDDMANINRWLRAKEAKP